MPDIKVLPFEIANLIAAGEVVDRPSSAVKELVENSIDAGADTVVVEIKNGGASFIRVTDNGCGISPEQLPTAILRHATSKIHDAGDLEQIITLGFRGEALAAISSVSKLRIISKIQMNGFGSKLECEGGEIVSHNETGCPDGTTVIIEELFYNIPARRKFLRKDITEAASVAATVEKLAMSKPDISFKFISDGDVKLLTPGDGKLSSAIFAVYGREILRNSISVSRSENNISVKGFIGSPDSARGNRTFQNFFINNRYIKSKTMSAALEQAYLSYVPAEKFPFCVLNLILPYGAVDVNVHPSKLEVKFSNEKLVFDAVYYAVRGALEAMELRPEEKNTSLNPSSVTTNDLPISSYIDTHISKKTSVQQTKDEQKTPQEVANLVRQALGITEQKPSVKLSEATEPIRDRSYAAVKQAQPQLKIQNTQSSCSNSAVHEIKQTAENVGGIDNNIHVSQTESPDTVKITPEYRILGEAWNSYIIVELQEKLLLIDKHAAHERIIFESLRKINRTAERSDQLLMIPVKIRLSSDDIGTLDSYAADIKNIGFDWFLSDGGKSVCITQIPDGIEQEAIEPMFTTLLRRLSEGSGTAALTSEEFFETALYTASCKAAIKAGRYYDETSLRYICDRLLSLPDIKYCPHGRPTAIEISKTSLERQFARLK